MRPFCTLLLVSLNSAALAQDLFRDGFEPGAPSSWSAAAGWSCLDGAAPVPGNPVVEESGDPGCLPGMVLITDYCIDRYEASLQFASTGVVWSPYRPPGLGDTLRAISVRGATPQGYIDQLSAGVACAASGKRLCTDAEWLRACQGPGGWTYPWGNSAQPGTCNDARAVHPAVEYYGTTDPWIYEHLDQPCLNQLPAGLERSGERAGCVSAEGPQDMMGNLHEWTSDPNGTFRGGFYVDTALNGPGCLYTTTAHASSHWDFSTGFRCCADVD
jgi:sulfatase modifying factor 1